MNLDTKIYNEQLLPICGKLHTVSVFALVGACVCVHVSAHKCAFAHPRVWVYVSARGRTHVHG